jgi:hypothetical protein
LSDSDDSIKIPIPILGGNVIARGTAVFVILAIMGTGWGIYQQQRDLITVIERENNDRAAEHESLRKWMEYSTCTNRLNLYIFQHPRNEPMNWQDMPQDLYDCAIKNFGEMKKQLR